jgi:Na+-driven multidrug efflux pump
MMLGIDTSLSKRIATLGVPVVLAMLTQTAVNLLDTAMVSRLPGSTGIDGVAGIGLSMPLFWAVGGFLSALAVGTQAITARRTGSVLPLEAGRTLTNSLFVAILAGALVSVLGYLYVPEIFKFLNPNPNVVRLGSEYCRIRMAGLLSMVATLSFKSFFDGIGKTHVHLVASVIMNSLNVGLNFLLIYGLWGFPRLEVAGAAVATISSTYVGLAIMILWSLFPKYRKTFRYFRLSNLDRRLAWEIVRLSLPSGLATVFVMSGFQFFLWVMGRMPPGPEALGGLAFLPLAGPVLQGLQWLSPDTITSGSWVLISFLMLIFMTSIAFGTATATLVGQSMGSGKFGLAERYGWESVKLGMYVMGALGLLCLAFPEFFLGLFTNKLMVIQAAAPTARLMGSLAAVMSAGLILVQALYGAGATLFVMKVEFVMHFVCLIPLAYLLGVVLELGMFGAWLSAAVYILLLTGIMAWKFRGGSWKKIVI